MAKDSREGYFETRTQFPEDCPSFEGVPWKNCALRVKDGWVLLSFEDGCVLFDPVDNCTHLFPDNIAKQLELDFLT